MTERKKNRHRGSHAPEIRTPLQPGDSTRPGDPSLYWPAGLEHPPWKKNFHPCKQCNRIMTDDRRQAVICKGGVHQGKAYLICRACGSRFTAETS